MLFEIYNPYSSQEVTGHYVDIIAKGIERSGSSTVSVNSLERKKENRAGGAVVISPFDAIKARIVGYKRVLFWSQGLAAEESFMRHGSHAKYEIIRLFSRLALNYSDIVFLTSKAMADYYSAEYNAHFSRAIIMPCFNEEVAVDSSMELKPIDGIDNNNIVFLYAGGLSPWQCFQETVDFYCRIEEAVPRALLLVLTKDSEKAKSLLEKSGAHHYIVDFVSQNNLKHRIQGATFGFCLRKNHPVNRVATPTKLSTYVANDIIPVFSSSLQDFSQVANCSEYAVRIDRMPPSDLDVARIVRLCSDLPTREDVHRDFASCFSSYYSSETYIEMIAKQVENIA